MALQLFRDSYSHGLLPHFTSKSPTPPTPQYLQLLISSFILLSKICSWTEATLGTAYLMAPKPKNSWTHAWTQKYFLHWWQKLGSLSDTQALFHVSQREFDYFWELYPWEFLLRCWNKTSDRKQLEWDIDFTSPVHQTQRKFGTKWFRCVMGWPWLDTMHPPKLVYCSPGHRRENTTKGSWVEIKTGRHRSLVTVMSKTDSTWGN